MKLEFHQHKTKVSPRETKSSTRWNTQNRADDSGRLSARCIQIVRPMASDPLHNAVGFPVRLR
ncbi:hypothetical protein BACCOPRO_02677 [Phocaeicola coprophilus DSM 18228 = JCM 13818]|uniref:Uncharacterized protein n=1 Tax=Phocaeicola coprophilus DSM 18228 = JCM 13818 TaxID=547042 RepID=S0FAR9_9BACT|nr:hypothetical protein BACCOPRO_02677 [Phocaeicola coprophilus DSM 18228 = JCM 13818]